MQKSIETQLLRHAKDFLPQLIEFKLSTVIHGSGTVAKPVFVDSPGIGEVYVPRRLKKVMEKVEKGEVEGEKSMETSGDEDKHEDYVIETINSEKRKETKRNEREAFVPLNVFDLEEQAK